ncbi:unnamed protein product [marine sediment metagenome]|uniref:Uncharacterized protein n=1 Tax=marine sediment metagenome TaxID=412755 RepID=X0RWF0_9ZZZZ
MVYQFKKGRSVKDVDAQELGKVLESFDSLTPGNLIKAAKRKKHLLHNSFEWNDSIAGNEYRKHQARLVINSVEVVIEDSSPVQAFINIGKHDEEAREYKPITVILESEEETNMMLEQALRELKSWQKRYKSLTELSAIFSKIDELELLPA